MGSPWGAKEKAQWFAEQKVQRSYKTEVLAKLESLKSDFDVQQYGALPIDPSNYPLFLVKSKNWHSTKPTILITGGVHGYETSGVQGALRFMQQEARSYAEHFNIITAPCISPWGYETINRWNPDAVDPNRSFKPDSPAEEARAVMQAVAETGAEIYAHFDLHETTDSDNTVFRPALAARDGIPQNNWNIPDGFYTVGNSANPQEGFQKAIIDSVRKVTHIAPADENGNIIGAPVTQEGVINYDVKKLFLCAGFTDAEYCTTTEVYPDSSQVSDEDCTRAQVAAVTGGLNYLIMP